MTTFMFRGCAGGVLLAGLVLTGWGAEQPQPKSQTKGIATQRPAPGRSGTTARGPLPDPALLDGSTQSAEKKSEYGMIGDFELPGDENVKNGKVGGLQNPGQQGQNGASGMPMGLPQGGGAAGQQQSAQQMPNSGGGGQQGEQQPGGPQNPNAAGNPVAGAGDPNAKPEGIQVAQLGGESSGQQPAGGGEKPPPVAIGDSAMQIQTTANAPGVVGSQQLPATNTQQHEKGTGTGGKGPTGAPGPNRVEKGRTIPAGL